MCERAIRSKKAFLISSVNYLTNVFRINNAIEGEINGVMYCIDVVENERAIVRLVVLM
jgi:hypothetical protein